MKKKLFALLLTGCLALSMTACGGEKTEEKVEAAQEDASGETADSSALGTSVLTELGEYKGVTYQSAESEATEEQVEEEIQRLLAVPLRNPQEVVTETSFVNIDYEGKRDGVAFDGGTAAGAELSIENSGYIPGFAESIVGMKVGDTKDCPMTFPEDYHSTDLAGAEVVFTITVNECWTESQAELNDEFAAANGYETVDDLYVGVKEEIQETLDANAVTVVQYRVLEKIIGNSTFEMNEEEIQLYIDDIKGQNEYVASYYSMDLETYVTTAFGMTMEEFETDCRETAIFAIQRPLVCTAIADAENMEVADEVYQERALEYANAYGYTTVEELEAVYTKTTVMMQIRGDLALDFAVENAVAEAD